MHDESIRNAVDMLRNHSLAQSETEHAAFTHLAERLLDSKEGERPDPFFVLADLRSYYETQQKVEQLFAEPDRWAQYALHNIAAMGRFSSDESIHNYARAVWDLKQCPCDLEELERVRTEYSEHDKCRIL